MKQSVTLSPKAHRLLWLLLRLAALAAILLFFVSSLQQAYPAKLRSQDIFWLQQTAAERTDTGIAFADGSRLVQRFTHTGDLRAVRFVFHSESEITDPEARFDVVLTNDVTGEVLETAATPLPVGALVSQVDFVFAQEHRTQEGRYRVAVTPHKLADQKLTLVQLTGDFPGCTGTGELDGTDTGAVSLQTTGIGMQRLLRLYRIFAVGFLLIVLLLGVLFLFVRCPAPVKFILSALLLGLLCSTVFPPFTSYDEDRHFAHAYYGAQKILYPGSEAIATDDKDHTNFTIFAIPGRTEDERDKLYPIFYTPLDFYQFYDTSDVSFGHANDTDGTLYMPLMEVSSDAGTYLPATVFILLGRLVGASGDILPLFARLGSFLAYIALCAWGIAAAPKNKHLLFACALLPSALLITCSAANDLYHYGTGILLIGIALAIADRNLPLRRSYFAGIALCFAAMLVSGQLQILPLFVWIGWLLYRRRYTPRFDRRFWLIAAAAAAVALIGWFLAVQLGILSTPADADPRNKMELTYILCHPLRSVQVLLDSALHNAHTYYIQWIGSLLGWGYLNTGTLPAVLLTGLLLLAGVSAAGADRLPLRLRAGGHVCGLFIIGLSFCVGFVWTSLAYYQTNGMLWGVQGRYFLSAMPLLLLLLPALPKRVASQKTSALLAELACFGLVMTDAFIFLRSLSFYLQQ